MIAQEMAHVSEVLVAACTSGRFLSLQFQGGNLFAGMVASVPSWIVAVICAYNKQVIGVYFREEVAQPGIELKKA